MSDTLKNFDLVLFGATGDLSMRKLLPNLYQAHAHGLLHPEGRILGVSRSAFDTVQFLAKMDADAKIHIKHGFDEATWASFKQRIRYQSIDVTRAEHFDELAATVAARPNTDCVVVYLSTAPKFFAPICEHLARVGLNAPNVRVVLEKPLGTDLASSQAINAEVAQFFCEEQIYRIDHYLGKESLQNLLPLRFGNSFFEPVWNREHIRSVQITIAEKLGVEERGEFYDATGALRDMVQNHIMQMLCFVAMERPKSLAADDIRNEKLKVVQALVPLESAAVDTSAVRGQYTASGSLKGYLEEHKVPPTSRTETYAAIRAEIDNDRWRGVPFYLRTGKRMAEKNAEIVLNFSKQPEIAELFGDTPNRIVITLQPHEEIHLKVSVKRAGSSMSTISSELLLDLGQAGDGRRAEAYELLLREVIDGNIAHFNRRDELEAAWGWVMPILDHWAASPVPPHGYPAGSWGPEAARALLAQDGNCWLEEQD